MAEERITEVHNPSGTTHTHTTVVTDEPRRRSGATWLIVLVLIILALVALWFFSNMSNSEVAENAAVAEAAGEVGEAANQVGNAVEQAADNVAN